MTGSLFLFCLTSLFLYNQAVKYIYGCEYFSGVYKYMLTSAMITHSVGTINIMVIMCFSYIPLEILLHYHI